MNILDCNGRLDILAIELLYHSNRSLLESKLTKLGSIVLGNALYNHSYNIMRLPDHIHKLLTIIHANIYKIRYSEPRKKFNYEDII